MTKFIVKETVMFFYFESTSYLYNVNGTLSDSGNRLYLINNKASYLNTGIEILIGTFFVLEMKEQ